MFINSQNNLIKDKSFQLSLVLIFFYLSEAFTKIASYFHADFHNYSALIKGGFVLISLCFALFNFNKKRKSILIFLLIMSIIFLIGQYTFSTNGFNSNFFKNLIYSSRYIFVFILILFFIDYPFKFKSKMHLMVYEKIVLLNSFFIITGFIFNLKIFSTYSSRFGFNGLFMVPSITTYFYALALTYFSYQYIKFNKKKLELLLVIIIALLVGTKALLLFLVLTLTHLFFVKKIYKMKLFYLFSSISIIVIVSNINLVINFLKNRYETLFRVYENHDLITMLTSYRNLRLKENFMPVITENWSFINYLFGGTDFVEYRVEFELFDVLLFWGIIGSILYFYFYFTKVISFAKIVKFGKIQIFFLLIIAMLSGTYFNNAPVALYLLVVLSSLRTSS